MAFEKRIDGKTLYEGVIVNVHMDRAQLVDGDVVRREVVEHPGGVTVIPVEPDGTVWCVRQFRYPFQREMLETPAGKLERGEDPAECARRELSEETGLTADELVGLGRCCTSPGFSTEVLHIYLATGLENGEAHPDAGEFLDIVHVPFAELVDKCMSGEIRDGKTVLAVLKAKIYLDAQSAN